MQSPLQSEIVVAAVGDEYEIVIAAADGSLEIGDLVQSITGAPAEHVLIDGYPVDRQQSIRDAGLRRGSRLEVRKDRVAIPVCELVGLTGQAAGRVRPLAPGVHQLPLHDFQNCPIDVDVQVPSSQGGTACLYVDVDGTVQVDPGRDEVAVNGRSIATITPLPAGAELAVGRTRFRHTAAQPPTGTGKVPFNRPPRAEFPSALPTLVAPSAPREPHKPVRFGWGALLIPVLIGGIMAALWSPMMAIFAIFSPAMMLANWYEDRHRARKDGVEIAAGVAAAMEEFGQRAAALLTAAQVLARRGCPGPAELIERIVRVDSRLWQRRHDHPDFLELGVGIGDLPWVPEVTPLAPDRADAANELIDSMTTIPTVPITVDLGANRSLGIAGHRRRQVEVVRWLAVQAAAHHGPADLQLLIVTDQPEEWDCLKWLPHLQSSGDSGRLAVALPGESADAMLAPLLELGDGDPAAGLRDRGFGPASLLIVDVADVTSAAAATVRRVLSGEGQARRAAIALAPSVERLPSSCTDILRIDELGRGELQRPSRAERIGPVAPWRIGAGAARRASRAIGRFSDPDLRVGGGDLADTAHLLDLLGLEDRSSDAVLRRWQAAGPIPRCVAPIGAAADGPLLVDWVDDGPHGLLAGTTGSGKSELLRSLVASLAASVDPEHLNFVLIDYKGGSAFDACAGLPHTVGMVTDLDGHLAHRALTCLEAELRHREEVLRSAAADNIHEYRSLGEPEPMPRLLVVIDEFAALAKELPDFMASLVDVAQRGRSLGVHLLLATQRPNGVINDAIRANTNLRLSLRVHDVADSMDVIGTGDAAQLSRSRPGRGYLRRGPGDIVAFQSALVTGSSGGAGAAVTVRPFELMPRAASSAGTDEVAQTDLELLVTLVDEAARKAGFEAPRLPWPDPLPAEVSLAEAGEETIVGDAEREVVIGLADEPHRQRRRAFTWSTESTLFFYGVQGSGTSSAMRAAIVSACQKFSPGELHVYAIDFDDQTLGMLERLPHVGAIVGAGERDRQIRLLRYLQREVADRRERVATDPAALGDMPRIVVAVDNYAGFRAAFDDPSDMAIKESLGRIVADGPGVGIVVLATAKQPIDIPTTVASLVPAKLVFSLADRYEYTGLGVAVTEPPEIAGRAFESGTSLEVQLANIGSADVLALASAAESAGPVQATPWSIELLPAEVKVPDVVGGAEVFDLEWRVPVALGDDTLQPVGWTLREGDHVLISGPARSGKSTTLGTIAAVLRSARPDIRITGLATRRSPLVDSPEVDHFFSDPAELAASLAAADPSVPHAVLVDDAEDVDDSGGTIATLLAERLSHRHFFVTGAADILRTSYGHWTQTVRRSRQGMALKPSGSGDGDLWQVNLPRNLPAVFRAGRGYLISDGSVELAQVAWQ